MRSKDIMKQVMFIIAMIWLNFACQSTSGSTLSENFREIELIVNGRKPSLTTFTSKGPVPVVVKKDFKIPLSTSESVTTDFYKPEQDTKSPLLIIQHGNRSGKEFHAQQAELAASWGINVITVEQPNRGRWLQNGKNLGDLVKLLHTWPSLLDDSFEPNEIILAGHSFGGSATAMAAGSGAPVRGIILLDPALVHKKVESFIKQINVPAVLVGADIKVFRSRRRDLFFKRKHSDIIELSIKDATHNDAQFPNMFSWRQTIGLRPSTDTTRQQKFAAAIVASVFGLVKGNGDQAQKFLLEAFRQDQSTIKDIRYK